MYPEPRYMPPAYWYSPSPRAFPADNSFKPSAACETWAPSLNNHGFPVPGYGCCGHPYNLHYPYAGPSHQFHCFGHRPPYPGPFCTPYLPPPFYYQMEQNPNGYGGGDGLSREPSHCCGCPNHSHGQKNAEMTKAEEKEPDPDQNQDDSLVPLQIKDKPYPIVWVPTGDRKSANDGKAPESRIEKLPSKERATTSDGWFPLDMKELASLLGGADKKRSPSHQNGDQKEQLQFPLVWLPSHQKQDKGVNELGTSNVSKASKSPEVKENSNSSQGSEEKAKREKTIPVVEVRPCEEDEKFKSEVSSENVNSSEGAKGDVLMTINGKSKRQSPSQPKSARLPPVCLRVDPLPKKRNGGSRSPSPPGSKGKLQETSSDSVRKAAPPKAEDGERSADNGICKQVPENKNGGGRCAGAEDCAIREKTEEQPRNEGDLRNESAGEKKEASESFTVRYAGPKAENKQLSDGEAARLIQSVYRGYEVRKWEPIKKLKQIAAVREQVTEVRNKIHSLKPSSDHPKDGKSRAIIGEMIMSLLLKLDGIQGLHPSLRDIRKSLAKELVTLQEKLDSLVVNKPEETQDNKCLSCNDAQLQQEKLPVPRGQLVNKPSQLGHDMGSNLSNGCDITQPNLPIAGVGEASQEMESPAIHYQEFKISDGGSLPERDEATDTDVRAAHTNIEGGGSESCDAISAGANSLEGAGPDPEVKRPFMAKVDANEIMQITDGSHDDGLEGLAIADDEVIAPREEDTGEVKHINLSGEGIGEMGCPLESPEGVTEEEKSGPLIMENDSLTEQEQSDVTSKVSENKEHNEPLEVLVPKSEPEHNVAAEQKLDTEEMKLVTCTESLTMENTVDQDVDADTEVKKRVVCKESSTMESEVDQDVAADTEERKLVACTEPWTMEREVDHDVAAEKSVDLSVKGENEALHDVQYAVSKDLSSESEREVHCSADQMLEGDSRHSIPTSEMQQEMLVAAEKETQLEDGGNVCSTETDPDVASPIVSTEAVVSPGRLEVLPKVGLVASEEQNVDDRKLVEVNARLRETMEKLLEAGNEQMDAISKLTGRVRELEKKLSNKKNNYARPRRRKAATPRCRSSIKGAASAA
ncbi:unnamed protein product [Linum tenue]|uniref:BAG domain-containing protein n=1 Tax=Linum tenue TaxID=586396 RepID=A0AAV0RNH1_9ROSI|nr:unnamed protein product [Linum tenue]